jgi:citrate lyase subunit beta / citryl-CoA lyase
MNVPRSFLFVPADSTRKMGKALLAGADALILDLEDAVADGNKVAARAAASATLAERGVVLGGPQLWVRVNAWETGHLLQDLAACVRPGLRGVLLPKARHAADLERLGHCLDALEVREGLPEGTVAVIPVMTETAAAVIGAASFAKAGPRVIGMLWGAEDLSADIGSVDNVDAEGQWSFVYQHARAQCLLAAAANGVVPVDTLFSDYRDGSGLERACSAARRDGFRSKVAIHPAQVETINRSFSPTDAEVAGARKVIEAFAANPNAGAVGIDGRMYDKPHLARARKLLADAGSRQDRTGSAASHDKIAP